MHHTEHQFSNLGCLSVADAVATSFGEGCSADAVLAVAVPAATRMQNWRGSCSTDAVLAVEVSTVVQLQHLCSSWWALMLDISNTEGDVTEKGDASADCITRAHSSLRGSVDFW